MPLHALLRFVHQARTRLESRKSASIPYWIGQYKDSLMCFAWPIIPRSSSSTETLSDIFVPTASVCLQTSARTSSRFRHDAMPQQRCQHQPTTSCVWYRRARAASNYRMKLGTSICYVQHFDQLGKQSIYWLSLPQRAPPSLRPSTRLHPEAPQPCSPAALPKKPASCQPKHDTKHSTYAGGQPADMVKYP